MKKKGLIMNLSPRKKLFVDTAAEMFGDGAIITKTQKAEAAKKAGPTILEPVMSLEVVMPEEYLGSVMGDVTSRRGNIKGMNPRNDTQVLEADVPLSEMFGYATELRSMPQGRAVFTMQFSHYAEAPAFVREPRSALRPLRKRLRADRDGGRARRRDEGCAQRPAAGSADGADDVED